MHIIEQRDTLVLTNGEGSPARSVLLQAIFVLPISLTVLIAHLMAAMDGWSWGWLSLFIVIPALIVFARGWADASHATVELDRRFGKVRVERRYALRTEEEKLALSDLRALDVETSKDSDGDSFFQPVLILKDGRRLPLGPKRNDRAPIDRAVAAVGKLG